MKYFSRGRSIFITIDQQFAGSSLSDFLSFYNRTSRGPFTIKVNNKDISDEYIFNLSDTLEITSPESEIDYPFSSEPCEVVYEDDIVYIVHKEPGIIIHSDTEDCLANKAALYQSLNGLNQPVRYLHRLDRDTSGLVMFVKNLFFQPWLDAQLREKNISRIYEAITTGNGKVGQKFTYNQPIGKDRHVNGKYRQSKTGKPAVTKCQLLAKKNGYLLMECHLQTGRTHQIRVHLSSNSHPIVNDPLYGVKSNDFKHMGLWAKKMVFTDPLTSEEITVTDYPNPDYDLFSK